MPSAIENPPRFLQVANVLDLDLPNSVGTRLRENAVAANRVTSLLVSNGAPTVLACERCSDPVVTPASAGKICCAA